MTPIAALSRSAFLLMMVGFLPPISAMTGRGYDAVGESAQDVHANIVAAGEGDAGDVRMVDQGLTNDTAAAGDKVKHAGRYAGITETFGEEPGGEWGVGGRFEDDGVAGNQGGAAGPPASAPGKLKGEMTTQTPYGLRTLRL